MKIEITRDNLVHALSRVQGIVEKKSTIPILSNVCLVAEGDSLTLTATDLEIGLSLRVPSIVDVPGKITVSAKKLFEIIRELPAGVLSLRAEENSWIHIESGSVEFKIVGLSTDEYPFFPEISGKKFLEIETGLFREIISKTAFAMTSDEIKHNLNGIYLERVDGKLNFVATDSHRLALTSLDVENDNLTVGIIIPRKGIIELVKNLEEENDIISLYIENNNVFICYKETQFFMRLVDGDFPNYKRVIPSLPDSFLETNLETFKSCIRRISILSNDKSRGININIDNESMIVSSSNQEFGEAKEIVGVKNDLHDSKTVGLNAKFILDVLGALKNDNCMLYVKDSMSPVMFTEKTGVEHISIIMPMTF